jgi:hypothetical protein
MSHTVASYDTQGNAVAIFLPVATRVQDKELVYLEQLLCDSVMQNIVDQTNLYK